MELVPLNDTPRYAGREWFEEIAMAPAMQVYGG
jgi:hypothetical protein